MYGNRLTTALLNMTNATERFSGSLSGGSIVIILHACATLRRSAGIWAFPGKASVFPVTNEKVRVRTGQRSMDDILSERRLRWLGHVIRVDHQRIPRQALHWEVPGFKRGPDRPRTNWRGTVNKDLLRIGADVAALNRAEWRRSVT